MPTRYSIVLSTKFESVLDRVSEEEKLSKADIIRNAVSLYSRLLEETQKNNLHVSLSNDKGKIIKEIILPA